MKVLHICETAKGGIATYLSELIPFLHEGSAPLSYRLIMPKSHASELDENVQGHIVPFRRSSRITGLLHLSIAIIKELSQNRPDIVHAHSTFAGIIARIICALYRVPVVYCPHGWAADMGGGKARTAIYSSIERIMAVLCKKIIAISEWERRRGIEMGINL
jgi:glycogen synthase